MLYEEEDAFIMCIRLFTRIHPDYLSVTPVNIVTHS